MSFEIESNCDKCRSSIRSGDESYCGDCMDELSNSYEQAKQQIEELREIVRVLEEAAHARLQK